MGQLFRQVFQQLRGVWSGMGRWARLASAGGLVLVLAGLVALAFWLGGPRYQPVFTGLSSDDLRAVLVSLRQRNVSFRVDEPAGAVYVPESVVHQLRLDLAMEGLPKNSVVGFEVLRETNLGLTDFERRARYYWALQGELTRTIRSLDGVTDARVHIVIPERSLFVSEQRPATASVLLSLLPGVTLSREQIRGIVNLVANSVEGLRPENVTVVDARGNVLSDLLAPEGQGPAGVGLAERLQLKRAYERELERSLQATLERIWGEGRVVARVTAELNFDTREERHEIFSPVVNGRSGIIRSEQRTEESFAGEGQVPAGVPGISSNVPGYVQPTGLPAGPTQFQRVETITNYEVNRVERRVVTAPGGIERISVAVWADADLDPVERQRAEQLVASAMGLKPERGDQVSVESIRFARVAAPPISEAQLLAVQRQPAVRGVAWWILAAVVVLMAWWWVRRRMRQVRRVAITVPAAVPEEAAREAPAPAELERRRLREVIEQLARARPEEFAQLLRSWLLEEA